MGGFSQPKFSPFGNNIIDVNFQCFLSRDPAHQFTAAVLTQMPDCISTNEVKKFLSRKKTGNSSKRIQNCFFNKQHEKFKSNYILAKAMIVLKNDLTRKNLWSIWHWITKQPHFILNFITNSTSRSWVLRVWWRLFIQYCRWKMLSREN